MCRAAAPSRLLIRPATAAVTSPARGNSFRLIVKVSMGGRHFHGAVTPRHFYVAVATAPTCLDTGPACADHSPREEGLSMRDRRLTRRTFLAGAAGASAALALPLRLDGAPAVKKGASLRLWILKTYVEPTNKAIEGSAQRW